MGAQVSQLYVDLHSIRSMLRSDIENRMVVTSFRFLAFFCFLGFFSFSFILLFCFLTVLSLNWPHACWAGTLNIFSLRNCIPISIVTTPVYIPTNSI
jgi:hypothetical protein